MDAEASVTVAWNSDVGIRFDGRLLVARAETPETRGAQRSSPADLVTG